MSIWKAKKYEDLFLQMSMHHTPPVGDGQHVEGWKVEVPLHGTLLCTKTLQSVNWDSLLGLPLRSGATAWCHDRPDRPTKKKKKKERTQPWDQDVWGFLSVLYFYLGGRRSSFDTWVWFCFFSLLFSFSITSGNLDSRSCSWNLNFYFDKKKKEKTQSYTDVS